MAEWKNVSETEGGELRNAAMNYLECLNPPDRSGVLIVTDREDEDLNSSRRRMLAGNLYTQLKDRGLSTALLTFDTTTSYDEMHGQVSQSLDELIPSQGIPVATVAYIGGTWKNRPGMYDAARKLAQAGNVVRFAGSLGLSTGDIRVLSQMGETQRKSIIAEAEKLAKIFSLHGQGVITIHSELPGGGRASLRAPFNVQKAAYKKSIGMFGEPGEPTGDWEYTNFPSGEVYMAPYPFNQVNGHFVANGLLITIIHGVVAHVDPVGEKSVLEPSQQQLIGLVRSGAQLPISELGFGLYKDAGIQTYNDCSVLTLEKAGPHIGFGEDPSGNSPPEQQDQLASLIKGTGFHHTDFVLHNPSILLQSDQGVERF